MTISFCVLIAYKGDVKSKEASLKYIILGAMSSAIFLYGLSLIYGITQTTVIKEIAEVLGAGSVSPLEILGMIFLIAGFAFKIAIVPFHMWAPDIYEGAPTSITVFLAVASKVALLYSLFYLFANMGAFGVVIAVSKATGSDEIKDYAYLSKRSPFLSAVMLISLLSLAGIPPLAGFIGKFYLFLSIIEKGELWLAFLSIGMSVVSVYYYLKVVKVMYFGESYDKLEPISVSISTKLALTISMIALVIFGIYPNQMINIVLSVSNTFLY